MTESTSTYTSSEEVLFKVSFLPSRDSSRKGIVSIESKSGYVADFSVLDFSVSVVLSTECKDEVSVLKRVKDEALVFEYTLPESFYGKYFVKALLDGKQIGSVYSNTVSALSWSKSSSSACAKVESDTILSLGGSWGRILQCIDGSSDCRICLKVDFPVGQYGAAIWLQIALHEDDSYKLPSGTPIYDDSKEAKSCLAVYDLYNAAFRSLGSEFRSEYYFPIKSRYFGGRGPERRQIEFESSCTVVLQIQTGIATFFVNNNIVGSVSVKDKKFYVFADISHPGTKVKIADSSI